jgi:hypothetical protein
MSTENVPRHFGSADIPLSPDEQPFSVDVEPWLNERGLTLADPRVSMLLHRLFLQDDEEYACAWDSPQGRIYVELDRLAEEWFLVAYGSAAPWRRLPPG